MFVSGAVKGAFEKIIFANLARLLAQVICYKLDEVGHSIASRNTVSLFQGYSDFKKNRAVS